MNFRLEIYVFLQKLCQHRKYLMNNRKSYNGLTQLSVEKFQKAVRRNETSETMAHFFIKNEAFIKSLPPPHHYTTFDEINEKIQKAYNIINPDQPKPEQLTLEL